MRHGDDAVPCVQLQLGTLSQVSLQAVCARCLDERGRPGQPVGPVALDGRAHGSHDGDVAATQLGCVGEGRGVSGPVVGEVVLAAGGEQGLLPCRGGRGKFGHSHNSPLLLPKLTVVIAVGRPRDCGERPRGPGQAVAPSYDEVRFFSPKVWSISGMEGPPNLQFSRERPSLVSMQKVDYGSALQFALDALMIMARPSVSPTRGGFP